MKTCSVCGKTYPDEYSFCLSDGTTLVPDTLASEEATVIRPAPKPEGMRTGTMLLFLLAGVLTLALGATIGVLYHFWPRQETGDQSRTNGPSQSPSPTANRPVSEPTKTPETNIRPPRTPAPVNDNKSSPAPPPPPDADEGTVRISFRRGRAAETLSGRVSKTRSFVLYAKDGQNLNARVRSADGCVSFNGRSPRLNFETTEGDNVITLINSCEAPARFTLTVNIR